MSEMHSGNCCISCEQDEEYGYTMYPLCCCLAVGNGWVSRVVNGVEVAVIKREQK